MYHERGVASAREGVDISTLLDQRANARLPVVGGRHMEGGTGPALLEMGTRLEKLEHARHVTFPRHASMRGGGTIFEPLVDFGTLREYLTHAFCVAGFCVPP
jgi:hypothetical protein